VVIAWSGLADEYDLARGSAHVISFFSDNRFSDISPGLLISGMLLPLPMVAGRVISKSVAGLKTDIQPQI
jgi:hypothetical protein